MPERFAFSQMSAHTDFRGFLRRKPGFDARYGCRVSSKIIRNGLKAASGGGDLYPPAAFRRVSPDRSARPRAGRATRIGRPFPSTAARSPRNTAPRSRYRPPAAPRVLPRSTSFRRCRAASCESRPGTPTARRSLGDRSYGNRAAGRRSTGQPSSSRPTARRLGLSQSSTPANRSRPSVSR